MVQKNNKRGMNKIMEKQMSNSEKASQRRKYPKICIGTDNPIWKKSNYFPNFVGN